nr:phosphatidate cytidylyltransferase [uncultured Butyricicoccus sp.]
MKARVLFGVIGFVFVLLALYVLPPVVLAVAVSALTVLAAFEVLYPTGLVKDKGILCASLFAAAAYAIATCIPAAIGLQVSGGMLWQVIALLLLVALFACLLRRHDTVNVSQVMAGFFGGLILPYFLLSLWRIFEMDGGPFLVLLPLVAAWGSDTCALFAGMAFGKHKLAPVVSPKKTVEGAVGGVVGATLLMLLVVFLLNRYAAVSIHYAGAAVMGALGAVIGQIGDLSFSIIKRQTGIKDYGHIFPGHGGVLDRFDSVIFVAPVVELVLRILGPTV